MYPHYSSTSQIVKTIFRFLGFFVLFSCNLASAAYTFTSTGSASGASGCTGNASGVYTCSSGFDNNGDTTTINNSSGPVTINITGEMRIRENILITSPNHAVTINVTSNLTMNDNNNSIRASDGSTYYTNVNINVGGNTDIVTSGSVLATIKATGSGRITLGSNPTIYGSLTTSSGTISAYGTIYGSLVSTTGAITKDSGRVSESIITTSGAINLTNATTVKHITCDCTLSVAYGVTVSGNIQAASMTEDPSGSQSTYSGSIYTTTGGVKLNYSSDVTGSISSATTVNLVDQNTVNSCVKSRASSTITLGWGVHANSVCCGNSCGTSCVTNSSSYAMPSTCTTEQIVISAYGSQSNGTYPTMELWINGTKYGSVGVTSATKDYFFNVVLPATITSLDVVFPNDAYTPDGDRNLIVNSLTIRGKTKLPTDAGVIMDRGSSSSATWFDGVDTIAGASGIAWSAALRFTTSTTASNMAYYAMDESSWNGTSGELDDTAGYTGGPFDGQGIGSPLPTAAIASPAISGTTGTCGYATFSGASGGSAFTSSGVPASTSTGAMTSVSFWMYWNGNTSSKVVVGWNRYNLALSSGYIGFNTNMTALYGRSSSGLASGWHHVVAIFKNGDAEASKLYIDGALMSLSRIGSATPDNTNAFPTSTFYLGGVGFSTSYRFDGGRIDEVKIYNGEVSSTQVTADYNATHACRAHLIAYYSMDELSWNGTAGELNDTAGYSSGPYDGQGMGSPVPTAASAAPAISGVAGTCGYATFSGGTSGGSAFTIPSLPTSTAVGAKTSVSFWMYWDGTNGKMPIGWNYYDLYINSSYFGFNTSNSDVYGTSSASLASGWHHVVAVFTNGSVTSNKLYIDGALKTLTQLQGTPLTPTVTSNLRVSGWSADVGYRFVNGRIDELKVYNGEISSTQVTADYNATHSCPSYSVTPSSFNCVATSANASTGHLYTQLAGTAFNIDVVALNASNAVETSYVASGTKNVTLELVDGAGSTACGSRSALSPAVSQTVTFSTSDAGRKSASVTVAKAYQNLRCRVTDSNATTVTACSSDNFAVRPTNLTISSSDANADSTGASTSATPAIKSGSNFSLTATANAIGYDGTPLIDSSKISAHAGAVHTGSLSGSFASGIASTGAASGTSFNYSEVGYFKLATNGIYDSTFTAVDSANGDCTTGFTASSGINACSFGNTATTNYFGRFYPDHFAITSGATTPGCGSSFSYFGQDGFTTDFTLTAQNAANATTQNYTGSFAKLGLTNWSNYGFTAATLPSGSALSASSTAPSGSWSNGAASVSAKHKVSRPTAATAPTSITVSAAPTDSDGLTGSSTAVSASSMFRYGRLWMSNVYGSELLSLTVPIEAQYYDGATYRRNQLDSCSVISPQTISMANYKGNLAACESVISGGGTMSAGKTTVTLAKPGYGNNGSVDLSVNLNSASGSTCTTSSATSATNANLPWFGSTNPSARETFGLFKSPVIYMRESY